MSPVSPIFLIRDTRSHFKIRVIQTIIPKKNFGPIPWQAFEIIGGLLAGPLLATE